MIFDDKRPSQTGNQPWGTYSLCVKDLSLFIVMRNCELFKSPTQKKPSLRSRVTIHDQNIIKFEHSQPKGWFGFAMI